ncbi:ABC transporter ATP-binding protein [Candidatus Woesearchaeota archaeon]|nr:ABC transporter ATP-binding protein [Candidatus Woesearchaeota archaeon]
MSIIEVKGLTYYYPGENNCVLKDVSFKVDEGNVLGIIGPSGGGKSTLMLALSGLIPHSINGEMHGKVLINGKDTAKMSMAELSQSVQILFQSPESQLFALNVEDEITFGLENLNVSWSKIEQKLEYVLKLLNIDNIRYRSIEELSSGQKQRVALAAILSMEPKILLFDEPTANLDPAAIKNFKQIINSLRKKHTIVIIEHNVELIRDMADRSILIDNGKLIIEGKPKDVFKSEKYKDIMLQPHNVNELINKLQKISTKTKNKPILQIKHLNFSYSNKTRVLSDIDLDVGKGDFIGIVGLNGSGKSTLALNIIGLLHGKGQIILDGKDITNKDVYERTKKIGYVFQNPNYQLFEEDLDKEISFGPKNIGLSETEVKKRVEEALHITNLASFRDRDPHALSVGQKRRVSIASILVMKPEIIIVDEPDTGLDHKNAKRLMDYVKKLNRSGKTIILISHSIELVAEYCNRIIGIKKGKLTDPKEVLREYLKR